MLLKPHDTHMILDRSARSLQLYALGGTLLLECEAHNVTTNNAGAFSEHNAPCPPGQYLLGPPVEKNTVPFGKYFLLLADYDGHHTMAENGRSGVGLHGGGSGQPDPFAPHQGWTVTHGCWRLANASLEQLVSLLRPLRASGGRCFVTVATPAPGAEAAMIGDDLVEGEDP